MKSIPAHYPETQDFFLSSCLIAKGLLSDLRLISPLCPEHQLFCRDLGSHLSLLHHPSPAFHGPFQTVVLSKHPRTCVLNWMDMSLPNHQVTASQAPEVEEAEVEGLELFSDPTVSGCPRLGMDHGSSCQCLFSTVRLFFFFSFLPFLLIFIEGIFSLSLRLL